MVSMYSGLPQGNTAQSVLLTLSLAFQRSVNKGKPLMLLLPEIGQLQFRENLPFSRRPSAFRYRGY